MGIYGTTVGAHRLWTHKTFKANTTLKFILMISQTMAGQVMKTLKKCRLTFDIMHLINVINFLSKKLTVAIGFNI